VRYGLLGEVQAAQAGRVLPLGGRRNRALLALLVLRANQPVGTEDIAAQVWGPRDEQPRGTVQAQVHRLRRCLPDAAIDTTRSGYVLHAEPQSIDVRRFEAQLASAQTALTAGRGADCVQAASQALQMWRGPALADLLVHDFAAREHSRLEELRREAEDVHAEALLQINPAAVVTATERLVADAPLRERRWVLLMRALYLTGRQADALARYARIRQLLDEQLGVAPGPELRELHRQILRHEVVPDERSIPVAASSTPLSVRYTRAADGAYLAYETFGRGIPLLMSAGNWSGLTIRQNPLSAPYAAQLGELARVTCYDARGLGMSDPLGDRLPSLEDRTQELIAVADAAHAERFVVYGFSDGAAAAIHAAAAVPQRIAGLILHNAAAWSDEHDHPFHQAEPEEIIAAYDQNWGTGLTIDLYAPTLAHDPFARRWWAHGERHAARPGEVHKLNLAAAAIDVSADLARLTAPTLVVHAAANTAIPVAHARRLAKHIPGARLVEIPTPDHALWSQSSVVLRHLRGFLNRLAAQHGVGPTSKA
jgi:DNA-binding SARP family transcriptional activator/alpha-beta hydrolase superfamily lysophospholipase